MDADKKRKSGRIGVALCGGGRTLSRNASDNIQYYLMMSVTLILAFVFCYIPMFGIIIAFQDYGAGRPFLGTGVKWVGLRWFKEFVSSYYFTRIIVNTVRMSLMSLCIGFPVPIIFALILNEVRSEFFKKVVQTISYMPHFLSAVVVAGIVKSFLANDGIIVQIFGNLGITLNAVNTNQQAFPWIYLFTSIWMNFGWSSILYLSTIAGIDLGQYEAAEIDGATRLQRIRYITLPSLMPLITIQLILAIGGILGANTELILQLYNSSVYATADVLGTYMYREALIKADYSYGTASGLLLSAIAFGLTWMANSMCRKFTDWSMW